MQFEDFKSRMRSALGSSLEHATPANVREFVDEIQLELWREEHPKPAPGQMRHRIEIPETEAISYEGLMRAFFARALVADRDEALMQLWILALDLAYGGIEELLSEKMTRLFNSDQV